MSSEILDFSENYIQVILDCNKFEKYTNKSHYNII